MGPVGFVAVYIILWWLVLFAVLPWGVQSQLEAGDIAEGTEPGAPVRPRLWAKVVITTGVAALAWLAFYGAYRFDVFALRPDTPPSASGEPSP